MRAPETSLQRNVKRFAYLSGKGALQKVPRLLHIALAIFKALYDEGYIPFLQGVHHAAAFPFDTKYTLQPHILKVMRSKRLLASQFFTDLGNRKPGILLQQMNDPQPKWMCYGFEDERNSLQLFRFLFLEYSCLTFHNCKDMNICS